MIFSGIDNQSVELKIANYQFPESIEVDWDSDWLNIYVDVKSNIGHWQTIDPSLTIWEFSDLVNWFNDLSLNKEPEYKYQRFTEPNLSFELLNSFDSLEKKIRIRFALELRPKSAKNNKEYFVDCQFGNIELLKISTDLKLELDKYPKRKPKM